MEQGKPLMQSDSPLVDFDAVCQKVRAAVEPNRTHAVSLHDEAGDVLWLSESSMGPDEHNAVREAAEAFTNPTASPILTFDLGDSRSAEAGISGETWRCQGVRENRGENLDRSERVSVGSDRGEDHRKDLRGPGAAGAAQSRGDTDL